MMSFAAASGFAVSPAGNALDNALIVLVGASAIEGNVEGSGTPATTLASLLPGSGITVSNQGHGGHSFATLMDHTSEVQALRGTAVGREILVVSADPLGNVILGSPDTTDAQALVTWETLVDYYRSNGWAPTDGRLLIVTTMHRVRYSSAASVAGFCALLDDDWATRADALSDQGADARLQDSEDTDYYLSDGLHLNPAGAAIWAQYLADTIVAAVGE